MAEEFKDFYDALAHGNVGFYALGPYVFFDCTRNTTRIVVKYKLNGQQQEPFDVRNVLGQHAEEVALQKLKQKIRQVYTNTGQHVEVEVEIYINFSPCHDCSERLLQFMTLPEAQNVTMTITIAALYNIVRKTCLESCITDRLCRRHVRTFFDTENPLDSVTNKQGLKNLKDAGVTLWSFDARDWLFVVNYFHGGNANDDEDHDGGNNNDALYDDLQQRMDELNIGANLSLTQRKLEDKRQMNDLNDIFEEEEVAAAIGQQAFRYPAAVLHPTSLTWGKMGYNEAGLPERIALPAPNIIDASTTDDEEVHHPRLQVNAVSQADAGEYFCVAQRQDGTRVSSYTVKLTVDG